MAFPQKDWNVPDYFKPTLLPRSETTHISARMNRLAAGKLQLEAGNDRTDAGTDWPKASRAALQAPQWLGVLGLLVMLGTLAFGGAVLLDARRDTWHQAEQASSNLVLALERDITRTVATYDLSLQGAADAMRLPGIETISPELRHATLFDRAATAEYLGSMLVLDAAGDIVADSTAVTPHRLNLVDRDYFTIHRDRTDAGLFISRPFRSRLRGGDASIAISRRLSNADGSFAGVVVGTLRLAYFEELFGRLDIGTRGSITLLSSNGYIVARYPSLGDTLGKDISGSETARRILLARTGQFTAHSAVDGVERLFSYRGIGDLPLAVNVAVSVDGIYQAWWRKAVMTGGLLLMLSGATLALCLLFRREMLRRLKAEQALMASARHLQVMASTDPLTGLANRRAFGDRLGEAWQDAARARMPLSLLMMDADCFKAFNDAYGHPAGDAVLQAIAGCIGGCLLRPRDLGARFGGEEFTVVLPDVDAAGALVVAERIRNAVLALDIVHRGGPAGLVSISIGVATAFPQFGGVSGVLVQDADAALYRAKHAGRNRVAVAGVHRQSWPAKELAGRDR
ncbi:MAG: sensor domain-containing diguanylate cyclase [Janthinobacterium lividum]